MGGASPFDLLIGSLKGAIKSFPDKRTGKNGRYNMEDIVLGAFSVFFTQSPSFLEHQSKMEKARGKSNAQTIFGIKNTPSDNHIRNILDPVPVETIFPVYHDAFALLSKSGHIDSFRAFNGDLLVAMDATWYFSSKEIHCENCSTKTHKDGSVTYFHSLVNPVIVAPGKSEVIPLVPEFILPQDGHNKQDCENQAAKRWINKYGTTYSPLGITMLGDDLYCRQPICEELLDKGFNFILVCKPESHKSLYEWVVLLEEGVDRHTVTIRRWDGKRWVLCTYRYANHVPLRDTDDTLWVNWLEVTITTLKGEQVYYNTFVTNHVTTDKNVGNLSVCGRTRWKTENENNNTLKTKGYHLEHNYGHGKKNLSSLLATLIILALLFHTILHLMDEKYRLIRDELPSRKTFFNDIRSLTRYLCFDSWDHLMNVMMEGLELSLDSG
jgi:hypothetical protein